MILGIALHVGTASTHFKDAGTTYPIYLQQGLPKTWYKIQVQSQYRIEKQLNFVDKES